MTTVKLVRVIPHEMRILVLLLDAAHQRVLPLWLPHFEAAALKKFIHETAMTHDQPTAPDGSAEEFIGQLLQTGGITLPVIHIEPLQDHVLYALITVRGLQGEQLLKARVGYALIIARQMGSTITVADQLFEQLGVALPPGAGSSQEQQLDQLVQRLQANVPTSQQAPRIHEPQNLDFTAGLQRWDLRGSFMHESAPTQWPDYRCGVQSTGRQAGEMCGYLQAQVPSPTGFADLRQAILADDLRGKQVRLTADLQMADVTQQASLYLRVVDPGRSKRPAEREQVIAQGTHEWTHYATQIAVPTDAVFVLFGVSLEGPGRLCVTRVKLEVVV